MFGRAPRWPSQEETTDYPKRRGYSQRFRLGDGLRGPGDGGVPGRKILADEGAGLAQIDLLKTQGLPLEGFAFTLASKVDLFSKLKVLLEQGRLTIPRGDRRLLLELTNFRYAISPSGRCVSTESATTWSTSWP